MSTAHMLLLMRMGVVEAAAINAETLEWQCLPQRLQYKTNNTQLHYSTLPSRLQYKAEDKP